MLFALVNDCIGLGKVSLNCIYICCIAKLPSFIRGICLVEHRCYTLQKCYTTKGCGGIAMFVLYLVLHSCSMVPVRHSLPVSAKEGCKTCGSKRWQHGTLRRVVHVADNMELNKGGWH